MLTMYIDLRCLFLKQDVPCVEHELVNENMDQEQVASVCSILPISLSLSQTIM